MFTSLRQASRGLDELLQSESPDSQSNSRGSDTCIMHVLNENEPQDFQYQDALGTQPITSETKSQADINRSWLASSDGEKGTVSGRDEVMGTERLSGSDDQTLNLGMGTSPLGFKMIVKLKRLARKERSRRRLIDAESVGKELAQSNFPAGPDESTSLLNEIFPVNGNGDNNGSNENDQRKENLWEFIHDMILGKTVSVLLIAMPFAFLAHCLEWGPQWVFWLNFLTMIPLASILGDFTEEVAAQTNQTLGGLINATFGNAVEVVVAIQALLANEIRVVQASMIGSIFSNLLLVLGCCFFFGGLKYKEQSFNSTAATANMSLLALSSVALVLPTPFAEYYDINDEHVLKVSRVAAVFLIFMYIQLLLFQLNTHAHLFQDDNDGEEAQISMKVALIGLFITTLLITVCSEYLVSSIDGFCQGSGISRTFVGLIILPVAGNAVEHITAVTVAMKDKMDLAMGVAVGSCTQISLFVVPLTVLFGWALGKNMTLNFPHFELVLFVLSIFTVSICVGNPRSNWLEGSLLITTYLMIAVGFWFEDVVNF